MRRLAGLVLVAVVLSGCRDGGDDVAGGDGDATAALESQRDEVRQAAADLVTGAFMTLWTAGMAAITKGAAMLGGREAGPDTLEPVILSLYEYARQITPARFMAAWGAANIARRKLGAFYTKHDIWLSPTTSREPATSQGASVWTQTVAPW